MKTIITLILPLALATGLLGLTGCTSNETMTTTTSTTTQRSATTGASTATESMSGADRPAIGGSGYGASMGGGPR